VSERDPVPLAIHHFPICSTFAFFTAPPKETSQTVSEEKQGKYIYI